MRVAAPLAGARTACASIGRSGIGARLCLCAAATGRRAGAPCRPSAIDRRSCICGTRGTAPSTLARALRSRQRRRCSSSDGTRGSVGAWAVVAWVVAGEEEAEVDIVAVLAAVALDAHTHILTDGTNLVELSIVVGGRDGVGRPIATARWSAETIHEG